VFSELGAQVTTLFNEPNGKNINNACGTQHPQALARKVVELEPAVGGEVVDPVESGGPGAELAGDVHGGIS